MKIRALAAALFLLSACGKAVPSDEHAYVSGTPSPATAAPTAAISGMFDVGGYELYLECMGVVGGPTLVYLHGMEGDHNSADRIPNGLIDHVRWCAYDRANSGHSDRVEQRRLGSAFANELHALLAAAEVDGPYVLVGASHGGLIAVLYAELYPEEVAGMVLLDGGPPHMREIYALIPDDERDAVIAEAELNPERVRFFDTVDEARAMLDQLLDVPVTFMLAIPPVPEEPPHWPIEEIRALDAQRAEEFVARFTMGRLVRVDSPHYMEPAVPDEIVAEIDRLLGVLE
jgi:pimeloyl-ACP methyl ester carboxylesterase